MKLRPETYLAFALGVVVTLLLFSELARFVATLIFVLCVLAVLYGLAHLFWPNLMRQMPWGKDDNDKGGPHAQ